jgi:hypothetical protein
MNYQKIHDSIISNAKSRIIDPNTYYENHHIIPKCEGGDPNGETVKLTSKEHRIIHALRYKFTRVMGNRYAYNSMTGDRLANAQLAAKYSHVKFKENSYEEYILRQTKAGINGGKSAFLNKKGWFNCDKETAKIRQEKGRKTTIENKLGMFSPEFILKHKESLKKKVNTPHGIFNSMGEAAKFYNVANATVTYRINSKNFNEWHFIGENYE